MPCQQDRVYAAERTVDPGNYFTGIDAVQEFLDGLRDTWWWESWIPNVLKVEVDIGRPGKGAAGVGWYEADALAGRMEFSKSATLPERRVVHELSHVIASARKCSNAHDPWFSRIYLELTYLIRGEQAYTELKRAFDTHNIDYDAEGLAPR